MKGISKKERLEQRIAELERQISVKDNIFDKEQGKRLKRTFFVLSGVIYLLVLYFGLELNKINIAYCLGWLVLSPIMAGGIMFISSMVLLHITNGAIYRTETIAKLKGELTAVKSMKYIACESEKNTEEIKAELKILNTLLRDIIDEYKNLELNEDYENDAEENEILKLHLEDLKFSLKMIDKEYEYLKRKKVFDDEVKENEED